MTKFRKNDVLSRRHFLRNTAAGIGAAGLTWDRAAFAEEEPGSFSFGIVTDSHYADIPPSSQRIYRDSIPKLRRAVETFNRRRLPLAVELGDFIDAGPSKDDDVRYLHDLARVYAEFRGQRHYVLGNHCVARLTKDEFLAHCGAVVKKPHYSFDCGRFHFVVLDANFREDGVSYAPGNYHWTDSAVPRKQQQWLGDDLKKAGKRKTIVLIHQNLDAENTPYGVKNAPEVRQILQRAGNVLAVFQGHRHEGGYRKIEGIHYFTFRAMVTGAGLENNAYAVVTIAPSNHIHVEGFDCQRSRHLETERA